MAEERARYSSYHATATGERGGGSANHGSSADRGGPRRPWRRSRADLIVWLVLLFVALPQPVAARAVAPVRAPLLAVLADDLHVGAGDRLAGLDRLYENIVAAVRGFLRQDAQVGHEDVSAERPRRRHLDGDVRKALGGLVHVQRHAAHVAHLDGHDREVAPADAGA